MTPQYILSKSLCRKPHCAGPYELRDVPLKDWPADKRESYLRSAQSEIETMDYASGYGEPGYSDPDKAILFANWNYFSREVTDLLERAGYAIEWSDEWTINYDGNMKAYRTQPDSYGWQSSIIYLDDGRTVSADEIESGDCVDEYIDYLLNDADRCDTFNIDWTKHGFTKLNEDSYESGFHPGQNDKPTDILKAAQKSHPDHNFIFSLDSKGQFDARFSIWARPVSE